MNHALELFICYLGMTGVTQVLNLFLQQAVKPGYMGVVAGETITIGCRFMIHPLQKIIAIGNTATGGGLKIPISGCHKVHYSQGFRKKVPGGIAGADTIA